MIDPNSNGDRARRLAWNRGSLLSSVGAALAGVGLGAIWPDLLAGLGTAFLAAGLAVHVAGMIAKRSTESADLYEPELWEQVTYWSCWIAIIGMLAYLLLRASGLV